MTPDLGYTTIYWAVSGESKGDVETVQSLLDENTNYIRYVFLPQSFENRGILMKFALISLLS